MRVATVFVALVLLASACANRANQPRPTPAPDYGALLRLPVYPHATALPGGTQGAQDRNESEVVALFSTDDSFDAVYRWYVAHMPTGVQSSISRRRNTATLAVFSDNERRVVRIAVDGKKTSIAMTRSRKR